MYATRTRCSSAPQSFVAPALILLNKGLVSQPLADPGHGAMVFKTWLVDALAGVARQGYRGTGGAVRRFGVWFVAGLVACKAHRGEAVATAEGASAAKFSPDRSDTPGSRAALYAACKDRLELPEYSEECVLDADCAPAGCGQEVCTSIAAVGAVVTSCEFRPCFQVVRACGCHDGRCTWSLVTQGARRGPPMPGAH